MVNCEHCQARNSLDSLFCKSCGREIPAEALAAAKAENAKLVTEGYTMLGEGRTDEAELLGKAALEADPNSAGAYSLLGMVYERRGEHVGALECYERVIQINPDSALDKIKIQQLRTHLSKNLRTDVKPSVMRAWLGGAAAVLFMGSLGAIFAIYFARPASAQTSNQSTVSQPTADAQVPFSQPLIKDSKPETTAANSGGVQPVDETNQEPITNDPPVRVAANGGGSPRPRLNPRRSSGLTQLPNPSEGGTTEVGGPAEDNTEVKPWTPPSNVSLVPTGNRDLNDPAPEGGNKAQPTNSQPNPAPASSNDKKTIIDIKVRDKGNTRGGGESLESSPAGAEAALRAAQEQHLSGRYDSAAKSYEKARSMGNDSGSVNQKLGQAYDKAGKKSEAIAAYERAVNKLESDARSGKPGAKEKLDSTKAALKKLKGG